MDNPRLYLSYETTGYGNLIPNCTLPAIVTETLDFTDRGCTGVLTPPQTTLDPCDAAGVKYSTVSTLEKHTYIHHL